MNQQPNLKTCLAEPEPIAGSTTAIRLLAADRAFLCDLSRVNLLSSDHATKHHYTHLKGGATRSLDRLVVAGLLKKKTLGIAGRPPVKIYQFATLDIAGEWGGSLPITGGRRNELHELIVSDLYFKTGRPADFRLAVRFTDLDIKAVGGCRPNALYTDSSTGELVAVQADSGNFRKRQILKKLAAWEAAGLRHIVWGQPLSTARSVPSLNNITLHRF